MDDHLVAVERVVFGVGQVRAFQRQLSADVCAEDPDLAFGPEARGTGMILIRDTTDRDGFTLSKRARTGMGEVPPNDQVSPTPAVEAAGRLLVLG